MRSDFVKGLQDLGYEVADHGEGRLAFPYAVEVGRFAGQTIQLGFIVGDDFPAVPPSGPHLSPQLLPMNTGTNVHPHGGIHSSPFGEGWEYWSRPFADWAKGDRCVRAYMAFVRRLFHTQ